MRLSLIEASLHMSRYFPILVALALLLATVPAAGQVVETTPSPPRTDQSVTVFFNADEGTGGLEDHDGEVYAHTGISTDQNPDQAWKCVKNHWPTSDEFTGNRDDTQLTQVETNRYKLEIQDIRAYYQDTSTECDLGADEKIETMNFVFRNVDGTKEGKGEGGSDIFVEVTDVSESEPFVEASITNPTGNPPLYPFMVAKDTTVTVSIAADTANVDSLSALRLFVDGTEVASSSSDNLDHPLDMNTPNRFQLQAVVEAKNGSDTLTDTTSTFFIRTPDVVEESRPSGVEDGINYNSDGSVTLSLNALKKDFAYVLGDFNDWDIDPEYFMKKDGNHWWITLSSSEIQSQTEYAFQYFVDGAHRIADPLSHKILQPVDQFISDQTYPDLKPYPDSLTENPVSVLEKGRPDFDFDNPNFTPPPRDELVVYELLVRDFLEQNNFQTLTDT
ncbi:MAG: alpha-amylase, partial [Bacteroidetes bacterium QH_2_63_10]